jgi:hypothetical protein
LSDPQKVIPKSAEGLAVKTYYAIGGGKNPDLKRSFDLTNWKDVGLKHKENQYRSLGTYFAPESMLTPDGRRVMRPLIFGTLRPHWIKSGLILILGFLVQLLHHRSYKPFLLYMAHHTVQGSLKTASLLFRPCRSIFTIPCWILPMNFLI